jgi:protocatechuate 4,5-dioxygenase, alpha chain
MRDKRDYDDIPGTYVLDGEHSRKGYHLNMFCMSLNKDTNREEFREDEKTYLNKFPLTPQQRRAVLDRDFLEMLRLGGNIYYTFKIAIFDRLTMQHLGALMSNTDMTFEEFRDMMISGGRSVENNRSKENQSQEYPKWQS